ncbi:hypothetical protein SASPL_140749 [Salvia splendens]|uniref:Uncharacterized protein n=1 Tax=Salvia splendens TaxID=180675 RepID=A0A8X8WS98_SALSN|nr:hypothetical protein SASPL_140749 [Salvia splendens]
MSPFFTLLKDLQPYTSKWVIKARCVRAYEVSGTSNKINISSLDCVLEDKEKFNLFIVTNIMGVVVDTGNVVTQGNSKLLELQIMDK